MGQAKPTMQIDLHFGLAGPMQSAVLGQLTRPSTARSASPFAEIRAIRGQFRVPSANHMAVLNHEIGKMLGAMIKNPEKFLRTTDYGLRTRDYGLRTRDERWERNDPRRGWMMRDYRKIHAWQMADDLTVSIYGITQQFPKHEIYGLTSQLRRAAYSVPSNVAEGSARESTKDYLRFLYIASSLLSVCLSK